MGHQIPGSTTVRAGNFVGTTRHNPWLSPLHKSLTVSRMTISVQSLPTGHFDTAGTWFN